MKQFRSCETKTFDNCLCYVLHFYFLLNLKIALKKALETK